MPKRMTVEYDKTGYPFSVTKLTREYVARPMHVLADSDRRVFTAGTAREVRAMVRSSTVGDIRLPKDWHKA